MVVCGRAKPVWYEATEANGSSKILPNNPQHKLYPLPFRAHSFTEVKPICEIAPSNYNHPCHHYHNRRAVATVSYTHLNI